MLAASNGTSAGNGGWGYESPNVVTYLSTWGQPGAIAWRCRAPRFGWPPVQHGLGKRLRLSGNVTFASRRMRRRWTMESHEASSRREVAPYGAMSKRLHSTRRGTRLDPGINWVRPAFLCSAKRGRFPALANLMPSIARSDGQCSRKRSRRPPPEDVIDSREHGASPDWKPRWKGGKRSQPYETTDFSSDACRKTQLHPHRSRLMANAVAFRKCTGRSSVFRIRMRSA